MSNLVIVESPAKAKTIKKYLGENYNVIASMGHIRDLPKGQIAIDFDNNFKPRYINIPGKSKLIKELKELAAASDMVYLATDPDREGEAISWHLAHILKLDTQQQNRVPLVKSQKKVSQTVWPTNAPLIWTLSMHSRPEEFWTELWVTNCHHSCGKR